MSNELQLIGQATPEQIEAWKKQYTGGVYAIEVDGHIGYFKNPSRKELNYAMSKADRDAALDMFEQLAEITFIGGSEATIKNDELFFGLVQELKVKMDGKKAKLVNL
jgi:hypothetical protein